MASKINSRLKNEKAHGSKPYDRPKQSIFRKVASTVRDIFVPSWLLNVPSWGRQNAEDSECTKETDDTHIGKDTHETSGSSSTRQAKRLKYDPVCDLASESHLESPSDNWFLPTSRKDHAEVHKKLQIPEKEKKDVNLAVNGDDHSENSEGSASTSGCSSLVSSHQERQGRFCSSGLNFRDSDLVNLREELNGKALFQPKKNVSISMERTTSSIYNKPFSSSNSSLWSHDIEKTLRPHTRPQPMFQSPRPSFNISSFGSPSLIGNSSYDKGASSPFYGGKTVYGGASAYRRAQLSTMPYQLSKSARSRITVKESSHCDDSEHMSSAAKRILNTLEKMSTPIMDVKKIPNKSPVDISFFTPASQRHNKFLPYIKKTQLSSFPKGPPVSAFNKSSNASLLRNHIQLKKNIKMEIPIHEHSSLSSFQSLQDSPPESSSSKGGGGKMRTRINQHLHHSSRANDEKEMPNKIDLPNIPIPIKRLPVINLPVKDKSKDNEIFTFTNCDLSSEGQWNFTFSNPIEYSAPKNVVPPRSSPLESPFVFSSPVVVSEVSSTSTVTQIPLQNDTKSQSKGKETQLYTGSVNDFLRTLSVNNKTNSSKTVPEDKPYETKSSNTYKAGNELLGSASSSFAGGMESQDSVQKHRPNISGNEENHDEPLIVDSSVSQSTSSAKSISTPASSGFGDRFKPSQNSWNCPTCLIWNNITDNKCIACETENPNVLKSSTNTALNPEPSKSSELKMLQNSSKSFKEIEVEQKSGTWTCDTCMVKNVLDKMKCIACETPRLSKENTTDLKPSGFKFGSSLPLSSTPGTFKFGSFVMNAVPTTSTSTFKFGIIPEKSSQSSQQTPSSTFKFGVIPNATDASSQETISSVFKFGSAPEATVPSDTKILSSSSSPVILNEGFKFNPPVSDATALNSTKTMPSSNITDTTSSIFGTCSSKNTTAFALNVPSTKSQLATESPNVSIAVSQTKSDVHSITSPKEPDETTKKPSLESIPKDQEPKEIESVSDQDNKNLQMVFKNPLTSTPSTASSAFKTTTTASGVGGFTFGNIPTEQSQRCVAFPFGNKTAVTKINPSVTAAEVSNIFTSTATVDSANGSTFSFKNLPTKPFAMVSGDNIPGNSASLQISPVTKQKDNVQPPNFVTIDSTSSTGFMFGNAIAVTASPFQFATATTTTVATTTAESIAPEVQKPSGMFAFGSTAASDSRDLKQGFTFKSTTEGKSKFSSQNQAVFSAFKQDPGNSVVVSSTTSPFEFGKSLPTPSSSGFIFGTPKTEVSQTASAPFSFSTDVNKSVSMPHFTGFSQSQPVTTTSTLAFSFGSGVSTTSPMSGTFGTTSTSSNLFSFSAKNNVSAANSSLNSSGIPSNPTPVFGCSTSQSVFGSNTSTIPSFGTGHPQKQEMQGGFNFGTNPSAAVTPSPVFKFGSTYGGPVEKKPAGGAVQNAGFNFNLTAQPSDMSGGFSQGFSPSTPLNFNFAAVPASPAPFQFVANTENPTSSNSGPRRYRKAVRRGLRKPND